MDSLLDKPKARNAFSRTGVLAGVSVLIGFIVGVVLLRSPVKATFESHEQSLEVQEPATDMFASSRHVFPSRGGMASRGPAQSPLMQQRLDQCMRQVQSPVKATPS